MARRTSVARQREAAAQASRRMIARGDRPAYRLRTTQDGRWHVDALPWVSVAATRRREAMDEARAAIAVWLERVARLGHPSVGEVDRAQQACGNGGNVIQPAARTVAMACSSADRASASSSRTKCNLPRMNLNLMFRGGWARRGAYAPRPRVFPSGWIPRL